MKKLFTLAVLLCCALLLCACGGEPEQTTPSEMTYRVTVVDALGNPCRDGIVVKFMSEGTQAGMQTVNENGIAEKVLPTGEYTVEIVSTDAQASYYYDKSRTALAADSTEVTVELVQNLTADYQELYAGGEAIRAYPVTVGSIRVSLTQGRNYFLFTPTQGGVYEFSVPGTEHTPGCYGAPHFVQSQTIAEPVDGVVTLTVKDSMIGTNGTGTSVYVLGVDAAEAGDCTLVIERTGDPAWDPADEPWQVYQTTATLSEYTLPEGATLLDFDLTAATGTYELIYSETDGCYHLNSADGPVVLMYITKPSRYLDALQTVSEKSRIGKYFYDENGTFLRKESYNECVNEYCGYADEATGVYPLTDDLIYIIQQRGECCGWFDLENGDFCLFVDSEGNIDKTINPEIAWMFALCYIAG